MHRSKRDSGSINDDHHYQQQQHDISSSSSSPSSFVHQRRRSSRRRTVDSVTSTGDTIIRNHQHRRRSSRGHSCLIELAKEISNRKRVVFITGAGMSVASGVPPFRGISNYCNEALWSQRIYTTATRQILRKNPLGWYNNFWIPFMTLPPSVQPNEAHVAMDWLLQKSDASDGPNALRIKMITQNIDGLIRPNLNHSIEAHGRIGLFKCLPDEDSDTDSESDEDDDRTVHLGHRRKWRQRKLQNKGKDESNNRRQRRSSSSSICSTSSLRLQPCPYQYEKSLSLDQIVPSSVQIKLKEGNEIQEPPRCPYCSNTLAPQALLFDEGYHSHDFYEFLKMEQWLAEAEIFVFVGTSFAVRLPEVSLDRARAEGIPVYNLNTHDMLSPTNILDAKNIKGKAEETLPLLVEEVKSHLRSSI